MDHIVIRGLTFKGFHGVYAEEKEKGQTFTVNADLYTDISAPGHSDNLCDAVNYAEVCSVIEEIVTGESRNLIEKVCEDIAETVLIKYPSVERAVIEVQKPEAPIKMEFSSVSVVADRCWHDVYVALGSNIGDSKELIKDAVAKIGRDVLVKDLRESELITTAPYGVTDQPDFLNGAVYFRTLYSPLLLLKRLWEIEKEAGRERLIHWGPRTLDLDIIMYDDLVMNTKELTIPHADMHNREFVLKPVCELNPGLMHPILGKSVSEIYRELIGK